MLSDALVREIVHSDVLSCPPDTPLAEAARRMHETRCSSILVFDGGGIAGIWTELDALRVDFNDPQMLDAPVARYMSSPVRCIPPETPVGEVAVRFRESGLRHFVVSGEGGEVCGIISQSDLVNNQGIEFYVSLRDVGTVFNRRHNEVDAATPLAEVVQTMRELDLEAIVVRDGGRLGIVTERDVVRVIASMQLDVAAGQAASFPLLSVNIDTTLYAARKLFMENRVRHLGVRGPDGELLGLISFADILANIELDYLHYLREALHEREKSLALSNQQLKLAARAFESTLEGIMVTSADQTIVSVNPAFTQITGYRSHEVVGKTPSLLTSERHDGPSYEDIFASLEKRSHWQGEVLNHRRDGEDYPAWLTISGVRDDLGRITHFVAVFSDVTQRKQAEAQIHFLAYHDTLTGLPNRALLKERLKHAVASAKRRGTRVAVLFLDLDGFKHINDSLGHQAGDQVLRVTAQRLSSTVRADDTVARLGGDEFVLVLGETGSDEDLLALAGKLNEALGELIVLDGARMYVSSSIGVATYPDHGNTPELLIQRADAAMYAAKGQGRNTACLYSKR